MGSQGRDSTILGPSGTVVHILVHIQPTLVLGLSAMLHCVHCIEKFFKKGVCCDAGGAGGDTFSAPAPAIFFNFMLGYPGASRAFAIHKLLIAAACDTRIRVSQAAGNNTTKQGCV